jgi:hypothetical protein
LGFGFFLDLDERGRKRPHVGDLASHEELQRVLCAGVIAEVDQPLIHDFGAGLGRDIAAEIDIELAGDLEIVCGPGIAHRVEKVDAFATGDRDQRISLAQTFIGLRCMRARQPTISRWLSSSVVHQEVFSLRILEIQSLDRILLAERGSGSSTLTVYISFLTW